MGKWFGQAAEIEALRAENHQLKGQVASLEARLRAAYGEAGVTALAQEAPSPSGGGEAGPTVPPVGVGVAELTEAARSQPSRPTGIAPGLTCCTPRSSLTRPRRSSE